MRKDNALWEPVLKRHWYAGAVRRPDYVLDGVYETKREALAAARAALERMAHYETAHGEYGWPTPSARKVR